jgi:hypothetical protein
MLLEVESGAQQDERLDRWLSISATARRQP